MTTNTPAEHRVVPIDLSQIPHPTEPAPAEVLALTIAETTLGTTGVHRLGTRLEGALTQLGNVVPGTSAMPGVDILPGADGADGAVVAVSIVVDYPAKVTDVAAAVREQVAHAVAQLRRGPVSIDVTVTDVHGPFDPRPA